MKLTFLHKWLLTFKVLPFIMVIVILKFFFHRMGWEFISLSPLFNSLISANVFLLGFLLAAILTDYKESERLPGELAASIETLYDEFEILYKKSAIHQDAFNVLSDLCGLMINWFYKKDYTQELMDKIRSFNPIFLVFEASTQPNVIAKLKQEQHNIRKSVIRIRTIRETSFVSAAYAIAEITTLLLVAGFLIAKIEPFYESLFFVGLSTFLLLYMIFLIKDLDNPFNYYTKGKNATTVSLQPLLEVNRNINERLNKLNGNDDLV